MKAVVLPELVVFYLLTFTGFTEEQSHVMTCVAKYESSFRTTAINFNDNASIDRGLLQINTIWHKAAPFCELDRQDNPIDNVRCAKLVYDRQGLDAWVAYKRNKKECDNYKVIKEQ